MVAEMSENWGSAAGCEMRVQEAMRCRKTGEGGV